MGHVQVLLAMSGQWKPGSSVTPDHVEITGAIASGKFVDASQTISNCGQLHIQTNGKYTDEEQMFAAGFFEGFTTAGESDYQGPA